MSSEFDISASDDGFRDESRKTVAHGFTDGNICGESASSLVYRIRLNGLRVAVKRLRPDYRTNPLYVAAYRKEFMIGQRLKHDALPVYREMRADFGDVYIVMDYVDGITLEEFVATEDGKRYLSSVDNARQFLDELLDVTVYLHRSGVIHCDLKPANILLRHSDRGVMLIDLDKAYSDTLDRTHGGTRGDSGPLASGGKPTAQKDFAAIVAVMDFLASKVPDFPRSSFKRFRKECGVQSPAYNRLKRALKSRRVFKLSVSVMAIILTAVTATLWRFPTQRDAGQTVPGKPSETPVDTSVGRVPREVVGGVPAVHATHVEMPPQESGRGPLLEISPEEIDRRFVPIKDDIDEGFKKLREGKMTTSQIGEMMERIGKAYQTEYADIQSAYRKENPSLSALDVEEALIKAYGKSRIQRMFFDFMQAGSDTVDLRLKAGS